jgi:hypothetical protein
MTMGRIVMKTLILALGVAGAAGSASAQWAGYCSGASPTTAWVSWQRASPDIACDDVRAAFFRLGDSAQRWRSGWYDLSAFNRVRTTCYTGDQYWTSGWGADAFEQAIRLRPADNCIFEVVNLPR